MSGDGADLGELDAVLVEAKLSREILQAVGKWVEGRWAGEGFAWVRSRRAWERREGAHREQVQAASSYRNRAGHRTRIWVEGFGVHDARLRAWRDTHPQLTVVRSDNTHDIVCWISFLDLTSRYYVDLAQPDGRIEKLTAWSDHVREFASEWFSSTAEPSRLVEKVPDHLVRAFAQDLVEYAVSCNEREQATLLVERALVLSPSLREAFEEGRELARRGSRPGWRTPSALGWSSLKLDLI